MIPINYPDQKCVHDLFEEQVERTPDSVAVVCADHCLTYREMNDRANQLAHYLRDLGVGQEILVGICIERSLEMVVAIFAVLKAGGAYVPLDPAYPPERLQRLVDETIPNLVLTQYHLSGRVHFSKVSIVSLERDRLAISRCCTTNTTSGAIETNLAYVLFTSGSTGQPKKTMVQHGSLSCYAQSGAAPFGLCPGDRMLQFAPMSFDTCAEEIYPCLTRGATLVLRPPLLLPSTDFLNWCSCENITVLDLPTTYWHSLIDNTSPGDWKPIGCVRLVIIGGQQVSPESVQQWLIKVGNRICLMNSYGLTETTIINTLCDLTYYAKDGSSVPIGHPVGNTKAYVLDRELDPVRAGVIGELYIAGFGLARGYLNQPALTAGRFVADPYGPPGTRMYRTGDKVRWRADGDLEYLGRKDQQLKIRGFRVEPEEVEEALRRQTGIRDAVVLTWEDRTREKCLVGYVVPKTDQKVAEKGVLEKLRRMLPEYLVPTAIVVLDQLPLTPNGKLNRKALPPPEFESTREYQAPRTVEEETLCALFADVLGISRVGVEDNLFELGAHSLMTLRVVERLRAALGVSLPLSAIFEHPSIKELSVLIGMARSPAQTSCTIPINSRGSLRPFFCVHAVKGMVDCYVPLSRFIGTDYPFYGLQSLGLNEGEHPLLSIEAMADLYISGMRAIQTSGPYQIGGWCTGGTIAFEMTRQLLSAGESVSLLAIFDEYPNQPLAQAVLTNTGLLSAEQKLLQEMLEEGLVEGIPFHEIPRLETCNDLEFDQMAETIIRGYQAAGVIPRDLSLQQCRRCLRVMVANGEARDRYLFKPIAGRLTVFQSSLEILEQDTGWERLANCGLDIYQLPMAHRDFVDSEVNARILADTLRPHLDANAYLNR